MMRIKKKSLKQLSNLMLTAGFLSQLFYSFSYPYIYAETLKAVSKSYISLEQILACLGTIILNDLWKHYGDKIYSHYIKIVILEVIADIALFGHVLVTGNLKFYFVFNIIVYALITKNMGCGGVKMRAKCNPTETAREGYDRNNEILLSIATLIGAAAAIVFKIDLEWLFVFAFIGNIVDNFFYLYIYKQLRKIKE